MNALLLGLACFGALAAVAWSDPQAKAPEVPGQLSSMAAPSESFSAARGAMTYELAVDPQAGETTEILTLAFRD